ncbi:MAG TPA: class II aldolase/adducin family protein [Candidatus Methylomirabilis sp.]|nr:class II aldolase/adducin family protein [Candidatus Methylomirabilis sp.]
MLAQRGGRRQGSGTVAAVRRDLLTACRILDAEGLVTGYGHLSARLPGQEAFLISPRRAPGQVRGTELLRVSLDASPAQIPRMAPLEIPLHLALYPARPDIGAILRIHPRWAAVLSVLGRPLRPLDAMGALLAETVLIYPNPARVATLEQGRDLAAALGQSDAILVRGHGAIVAGRDVVEATVKAVMLEDSARLTCRALSIGEPQPLTREEWHERHGQSREYFRRSWDYLTRRAGGPAGGKG